MSTHLVLRAPGQNGQKGPLLAMGNWGCSGRVWLVWQRPVRVLRSWAEVAQMVARTGVSARVEVVHGSLARRPAEPPEQQEQSGGVCTTLPGRRADQPGGQRPRLSGKHRIPRVRRLGWRGYVVAAALVFGLVMLLVPLSCGPASASLASTSAPRVSSPEIPSALVARLSGETTRWQDTRADRSRLIYRDLDHTPAVRRGEASQAGLPCAAAGRLVRPPAAALKPTGEQNGAWA